MLLTTFRYTPYAVDLTTYAEELVHGEYTLEEKIEVYLGLLVTPGYWGGTECIAALANFFGVSILVHQDNARIRFDPV